MNRFAWGAGDLTLANGRFAWGAGDFTLTGERTDYNSNQPRDEYGKWTAGAGSGEGTNDRVSEMFKLRAPGEWADTLKDADPEAVAWLKKNAPDEVKFYDDLTGNAEQDYDQISVSTENGVIRVAAYGGSDVDEIDRIIDYDNGEIIHHHFAVKSDIQGQGVAKSILAGEVASYPRMGINKVTLNTGEVGSYAWAKYGFVAEGAGAAFFSRVNEKIERLPDAGVRAALAASMAQVGQGNAKALWDIADTAYGKEILIGSGWSGSLDLTDEESMARFNNYVGGKS